MGKGYGKSNLEKKKIRKVYKRVRTWISTLLICNGNNHFSPINWGKKNITFEVGIGKQTCSYNWHSPLGEQLGSTY